MNAPVTNLPARTEAKRSVLVDMATRFGMEPKTFADTVCATVFPKEGTNEEFLAFLLVAKEYNLNPLTKEIYAFPKKGGGIQPIVSIDGWCNLINSHPKLNGIEFDDHVEPDGKVSAITARIWRKDRDKPIVVTEYLAECVRATDPWRQYPRRMLRHKALIQCARYAFGFAGIVDPDEAERIGVDVSPMRTVSSRDGGPPAPDSIGKIEHKPQVEVVDPRTGEIELVESGRDDGRRVEWGDAGKATDAPLAPDDGDGVRFDQKAEREWLNDLSGAFSGCESLEQLGTEQRKLMAPRKNTVSTEAWTAAQRLAEDAYHRVKEN